MAKWFVTMKKADFDGIARKYHISPVLARILRNREVTADEDIRKFLNGTLADLYEPEQMKDLVKGCKIALEAIRQGKNVRIIGDYDIDGICSTHILKRAFTMAGADVDTAIPHRIKDGYGLSDHLIEVAHEEGRELIVTCDNGIAAAEQIAYANSLGMGVIVTDHHEVPYRETESGKEELLPPALAVIDPKREGCEYPYKGICGAVVAYKFADVLLKMSENVAQTERELFLQEELAFAAIATVGDVMELLDENRLIVRYGLREVEQTTNTGLRALIDVCGLVDKKISPYQVGFVLGPCINATGRLDTAKRALELFETTNEREAVLLATELKELNENRKGITQEELENAIEMIERKPLDKVMVVYLPQCHESIAGIIAGRLRERYLRPAIVLTRGEEGVKGSGRSIESYSMYDKLHEVEDLFTKYGGHPMAAGLSMADESDVEKLRKRLNENADLTEEDFVEKVHIDVPTPLSYLTLSFVEELARLEPYGNGNPKPLFAQKGVCLKNGRVLGKNRNVAKFSCEDGNGRFLDAVYFGEADEMLCRVEAHDGNCSIVYYPDINEYNGKKSVQIVVKYYDFNS
ncbi:MAG: single-stranded-DNA-specific exonuclease RecJ [Lachnospiraceae bacterium]|jgi:single-stranded-DNA-specific exonuclease|nr:single-stranded-DNA-specific exonuclease RecJ [Lachnospiraceae bacterium]